MDKNMQLLTLIDMLRELDLEKNDKKAINEVLEFIASK